MHMTATRAKLLSVRSSLTISDGDLGDALHEALLDRGWFTHVVHLPARVPTGPWVSLLRLKRWLWEPSDNNPITHLCLIEKQGRVATAQARLKVSAVLALPNIDVEDIKRAIDKTYRRWVDRSFSDSWASIPEGTGGAIVDALSKLLPELADEIRSFIDSHSAAREFVRGHRDETAAAEKDALVLCMEIAGIDRDRFVRAASIEPEDRKSSFLGALTECRVYEDDLIMHDVNSVPGFNKLQAHITGAVEFEDEQRKRLTVINANRKPLERAMGVDIIYYHETYHAFTFVQYKMMDGKRADGQTYFDPNTGSTQKELASMSALWAGFQKTNSASRLADYRMALCPFFFKLCKRLQLVSVESSISPGAYLSLDHLEILIADKCTTGRGGGRQIGYFNLDSRYLRTGDFIDLVRRGMVGTKQIDTGFVDQLVERLIRQGHSVLFAIEKEIKERAA